MGPFKKLGTATGSNDSVILSSSSLFTATGHCAVIRDDAGVDWMFYHAYAQGQEADGPRMLMLDRVQYVDAANGAGLWPFVGQPSANSVPGPTVLPAL